ncbi:MAG: adenosine deaminase [Spirochaetes bacterium]|jgi:adenosine deaminase|nr:adenosine deaminase [Spirochaetota bacterium]
MSKNVAATPTKSSVRELLQSIPKTEIHLHIEGLVSVESIWELMKKHKLDLGIKTKAELQKRFQIQSLNEFIDLFINIVQATFLDEDDLDFLISDAENYLSENNIRYAEIFFAPTKLIKNGLRFDALAQKLDDGAEYLRKQGYDVRYIVDVSRGFGLGNAMRNLELTAANRTDNFIGLGLGGAEQTGPAREYAPVFERARKEGFHLVAHAGEDVGPHSIWDTIDVLKAERIGHGTSAILDQRLMHELRDRQVPLEICPTSNLFTRKYAQNLEQHPIRSFYDLGMYVTVNTDDPTLFGVNLVDEYANLVDAGVFSVDEIIEIIKNGIYATFMPTEEKDALWQEVKATAQKSSLLNHK